MTVASIEAWFRSKSITAHSVVAMVTSVALIIMTDETVRNWILQLFSAHPKIGTMIVAAAGIWLKYSSARSPAGVVAEANVVMQSNNPPTPEAVQAATVPATKP